jgi:hypothetical protein
MMVENLPRSTENLKSTEGGGVQGGGEGGEMENYEGKGDVGGAECKAGRLDVRMRMRVRMKKVGSLTSWTLDIGR